MALEPENSLFRTREAIINENRNVFKSQCKSLLVQGSCNKDMHQILRGIYYTRN
jgi:hypothetical protein